jgi:hypothetical protein
MSNLNRVSKITKKFLPPRIGGNKMALLKEILLWLLVSRGILIHRLSTDTPISADDFLGAPKINYSSS